MEVLILIAMGFMFLKFGGFGLSLFGVRFVKFGFGVVIKYFKIVLIILAIALAYSYIDSIL